MAVPVLVVVVAARSSIPVSPVARARCRLCELDTHEGQGPRSHTNASESVGSQARSERAY